MLTLLCALLVPFQTTLPEEAAVVRWAHLLLGAAQPDLEVRIACSILDGAEAAVPGTAEVSYQRAVTQARGGQRAEAIAALEEARRRGWVDAAVARWDEGLASLRAEAAFDAVVWAMEADARALDQAAPQESAASDAQAQWALAGESVRATAIERFDDERCIAGFSDGSVIVLECKTGRGSPEYEWYFAKHPAAIGALAVDPRGELVAASSADGRVALWSIATPDYRDVVGFPGAFVPPGRVIRPGHELWDVAVRVAWSSDGSHLMTFAPSWLHGPPAAPVQLFDRSGALVFSGIDAWFAALSPTEPLLAAVHTDELQLAWPGVRDQRVALPGAQDGVAFSPDGTRIAVGGLEDRLWILDSATGAVLVESRIGLIERNMIIFHPVVTRLHWSPDGRWLGGTSGKGCNVVGIDPGTGKAAWMSGTLGARMYEVFDAHWTADSRYLLYGFGRAACVASSAWERPNAPSWRLPLGELVGVAPVGDPVDGGASVIASTTCIARVRHDDRTIDWSCIHRQGMFLLRGRSGYVEGLPQSDSVTLIGPGEATVRVKLTEVFSPKRAAASRAGVAVRPAKGLR